MISIKIPDSDLEFNTGNYLSYKDILKHKSGIYLFYDLSEELLYIGKATDLYGRILSHVNGSTNLKDVYHNFEKVKIIYIDNILYREIYETYMINILQPKLNVEKVYTYKTSRYLEKFNPTYKKEQEETWDKINDILENFSVFNLID